MLLSVSSAALNPREKSVKFLLVITDSLGLFVPSLETDNLNAIHDSLTEEPLCSRVILGIRIRHSIESIIRLPLDFPDRVAVVLTYSTVTVSLELHRCPLTQRLSPLHKAFFNTPPILIVLPR